MMRFLDKMEPVPEGVDNSASDLQPRVDALVMSGIRRLGSAEAAMVEKVWRRAEHKPRVAHVTMEWLRHYHQVRFMYDRGGIWDSNLATTRLPFETVSRHPGV